MKLKTKLLFGIFLLLIITSGTIIYYATSSILKDKQSYLFELASIQAQAFSEGINHETDQINNLINLVKDEENPDKLSFLEKNKNYLGTFKTDALNKSPEILLSNNSSPFFNSHVFQSFIDQFSKEKNPIINSIVPLKVGNQILLSQTFINAEEKVYVTHVFTLLKQISQIEASKEFISFIEFENEILTKGFTSSEIKPDLLELKNSPILQKTLIKDISINGKIHSVLISLHKVKFPKIILAMATPTEKAFESSKNLAIQTIIFSFVLLSIAMICGIIFSSKITNPINQLIKAAENTSKGIYTYKENISTRDELKVLGRSFEDMNEKLSDLISDKEKMIIELDEANKKLVEFNRNLEKMVKDRTEKLNESNKFIKAMINSLDQGLIVFDQNLKLSPIFTKAAETIFDFEIKSTTHFNDLIQKTEPTEVEKISKWANITFSNLIPMESALSLGPQSFSKGADVEAEDYKFIDLKYYPMINADQKLTNLVAVATDVTKDKIHEHNFEKRELYVQMILKILNSKSAFQSFLNEKDDILAKLKTCYNPTTQTFNFQLAMMMFHSLTGGFGMYHMKKLQQLSRFNEEEILNMMKEESFDLDRFQGHLAHFEEAIELEIKNIDQNLGTKFSGGVETLEFSKEEVLTYFEKLKKNAQAPELTSLVEEFEKTFIYKSFKELTKNYEDLCLQLAHRLGKKLLPFNYTNENIKLDAKYYESFFNSLVHLFRNNMDHGIEMPTKRSELKKDEAGEISLSIESENNYYSITISDNGAGINPERIREKLLKVYPDKDFSHENDQEIIYHIFDPHFSTKDEANDISGRGVGMSAIQEVLERIGGKVTVYSAVNKGTVFNFILPRPQGH